jgi:hypothetical protein
MGKPPVHAPQRYRVGVLQEWTVGCCVRATVGRAVGRREAHGASHDSLSPLRAIARSPAATAEIGPRLRAAWAATKVQPVICSSTGQVSAAVVLNAAKERNRLSSLHKIKEAEPPFDFTASRPRNRRSHAEEAR